MRRFLRSGIQRVEILGWHEYCPSADLPMEFRDVLFAFSFLCRFMGDPFNMATLRHILAEEYSAQYVVRMTDHEVCQDLAVHIVRGHIILMQAEGIVLRSTLGGGASEDAAETDEAAESTSTVESTSTAEEASIGVAAGVPTETVEKTWVGIELVDEDGNPVPDQRYELTLPDGSIRKGTLDANGKAMVRDIDPGTCWVSFVNLPGEDWDPA